MVAGTVSGLEITKPTDFISQLEAEATGLIRQLEIPAMDAAHVQILKDLYEMRPPDLGHIALQIPYDQLDDEQEALWGSIVYYRRTVSSVDTNNDDELEGFTMDINEAQHSFDPVAFTDYRDRDMELDKYDIIEIGMVTTGTVNSYPEVHTLYIVR